MANNQYRPVASALTPTVAAIEDAFTYIAEGAVISVPIGSPHENFDIVEWCARHGKQILNRFDSWPLSELLIENTRVRVFATV